MKKKVLILLAVPIISIILFQTSNIEIRILKFFYSPTKGWFLRYSQPWEFIYTFAPIPGLLLAGGGLLTYVSSFFVKKLKKYSRYGLFLFLVMLIGPGLIVNTIFKDHWGRPRPRQIIEFNGTMKYLRVWQRGVPGKGKSFPSGHASVGFYLFTPYFFLRKKRKKLAYGFLGLGIFSGGLIGLTRMIQGAHFITDVLFAGIIVYAVGEILAMYFRFDAS